MAEFDALKINPSFPETVGGWNEFTKEVSDVIGKLNTKVLTNKLVINNGEGEPPESPRALQIIGDSGHGDDVWIEAVGGTNKEWGGSLFFSKTGKNRTATRKDDSLGHIGFVGNTKEGTSLEVARIKSYECVTN